MGFFKADTAKLADWLKRRKTALEAARTPHESVWTDLRDHFEPKFARALDEETENPDDRGASRGDEKILNSTPRTSLLRLGAGMQSGISSPARQWFRLAVPDRKLNERAEVRAWLDDTTQRMTALLQQSNFYVTTHEMYLHLGCFGTACALIVPADDGIHTVLLDEGSYWLAENRRGRVDTCLRRVSMTASQIKDEYGERVLPDVVKNAIDAGRHEQRWAVWNLICPNDGRPEFADLDKKRPFASVHWIDGVDGSDNGVLAVRSFSYNPILAPRWANVGGVYGHGPGHIALGDAKELQKLESDSLKNIAQMADPSMMVPDSMRGQPVNTYPGGVVYASPMESEGIKRLFEFNPDISGIENKIQQLENRIGRIFYNDLFAAMLTMPTKQMTAREVAEISGEKMVLLGPVLTRLNNDLLDPVIDAAFAVQYESGNIREIPDVLQGIVLRPDYISALHAEQAASSRIGSLYKMLDIVAMVAGMSPSVVDKIDADQIVDDAAESLAVPAGSVRDDKTVEALRAARAKQQAEQMQAMQEQQMISTGAKAARDLGGVRVGDKNGLEKAIQGMGGEV